MLQETHAYVKQQMNTLLPETGFTWQKGLWRQQQAIVSLVTNQGRSLLHGTDHRCGAAAWGPHFSGSQECARPATHIKPLCSQFDQPTTHQQCQLVWVHDACRA